MNLFKSTVAAAAIITCCLGNEMPAHSMSKLTTLLNTAQVQFNVGNEQLGCTYTNLALIADDQKPSGDYKVINKLYDFAKRCNLSIY